MRRAGLVVLVALVAIAWPFVASPYVVFLTTLILVNGIVTIGLNLLTGYTNQLSFGHAGFVAIGAYTGALLTIHAPAMPVPFTLLLAGLVTALVGLALGIPCLRLEGLYLAMATLAFGFVVLEAILNLDWLTRGGDGLRVPPPSLGTIPLTSETARYFLVAAVTVVMGAAALSLVRTRTGHEPPPATAARPAGPGFRAPGAHEASTGSASRGGGSRRRRGSSQTRMPEAWS